MNCLHTSTPYSWKPCFILEYVLLSHYTHYLLPFGISNIPQTSPQPLGLEPANIDLQRQELVLEVLQAQSHLLQSQTASFHQSELRTILLVSVSQCSHRRKNSKQFLAPLSSRDNLVSENETYLHVPLQICCFQLRSSTTNVKGNTSYVVKCTYKLLCSIFSVWIIACHRNYGNTKIYSQSIDIAETKECHNRNHIPSWNWKAPFWTVNETNSILIISASPIRTYKQVRIYHSSGCLNSVKSIFLFWRCGVTESLGDHILFN